MTKEEVVDLIRDAGFGFLATTEGDHPRVRPMMPYLTDDGKVLIALLPRSRSLSQIKKNPLVELCFVDRKMWYCRITGKASIKEDLSVKETLWTHIPMLKQYFGGVNDPNFQAVQIEIQDAEAMTPHQKSPEKINLK